MFGENISDQISSLIKICEKRRELLRMLSPRNKLLKEELKKVNIKDREKFCPLYFVRRSPIMPCAQQPTQLKKREELCLHLAQVELAIIKHAAKTKLAKK